jgi:transposase
MLSLSVQFYRFFPSSKTCSSCGWIKQDLKLSIREWTCESCGEVHDRDINAAKNILKQGLNILSGCGMQSDIKQKRDEALPLGEFTTPEAQPIGSAVGG